MISLWREHRRRGPQFWEVLSAGLFVWLLWFLGEATAQGALLPDDPQDPVLAEVLQASQRGDYPTALRLLDQHLRFLRDSQARISLLFYKGEIARSFGDYETASAAYAEIERLCESPQSSDALLAQVRRAEILTFQERYAEALALYDRVQQGAASQEGGLYRQLAESRSAQLRALLERLRRRQESRDPRELAHLTFEIAKLYEDLEVFDRAVREYRDFILQNPDDDRAAEAQYAIGRAFVRQGRHQEAATAFGWVVQQYVASGWDALALFQLGKLALIREDFSQALELFDRLLRERPTFYKIPAVLYLRGYAYERMGELHLAARAYREFLDRALKPRAPGLLLSDLIGRTEKDFAALEAALEAKVLELERRYPDRLLRRAQEAFDRGRYAEAVAMLRRLIAEYPDGDPAQEAERLLRRAEPLAEIGWAIQTARSTQDLRTRARAYFHAASLYEDSLKDPDRALMFYEEVVRLGDAAPEWSARALYAMGRIYSQRNNGVERALALFQEIVSRSPDPQVTAKAWYAIGRLYAQRRRAEEALNAFAAVLQVPETPAYLLNGYQDSTADAAAFQMARVQYELRQQPLQAIQLLRDFIRTRPRSPRLAAVWLYLSRIYEATGDRELATDALQQAVRLASESVVQLQWIRSEFSEYAHMEAEPLFDLLHRRLSRLRGVAPAPDR
ncbi:MAG: hypothetical protein KatS3mg115_0482 [Candidatus Poribacteria bacterium]|nr:MAG: hypothetical protein KatS3mg115_0482 [Candidatus Poribacteria bacterium]